MQTNDIAVALGKLEVKTTHFRGHSIEEISSMAVDRIVSISDTAPENIKAQAHIFKDACQKVIAFYMDEAIKNHICTICNKLEKQGQKDLANIIRRL